MLLIVDTLSFRANFGSYEKMVDFLGIEGVDFLPGNRFNMNYLTSLYFEGIKIGIDGQAGWDTYVNMSGKGCRAFEDIRGAAFNWFTFISELADMVRAGRAAITRIDLAGDEFEGVFSCDRLEQFILKDKFVSRCPKKSITLQKFGKEILYVGSPQSLTLLRIYNKKLERGFDESDEDIPHWWRCELQCRDEHAQQIVLEWSDCGDVGAVYCGHTLQHIRFTTKPNKHDGTQSRLNTASWWSAFLCNAEAIKWVSVKGSEYNMTKLERYAIGNAGSSVKTMILSKQLSADELFRIYTEPSINLRQDQIAFIKSRGGL